MPPISQSSTSVLESSAINIGGSVAARIARHTTSSSTTSSSSSSTSTQDDGFGEYRNLCEIRIRKLERYKKAKSFCSLEDGSEGSSFGYGSLASQSSTSTHNLSQHSSSSSTCSEASTTSEASISPAHSSHHISTGTTRPSGGQSIFESQVELLKQKMISLMENDVQLLQKLVALGETIQELKTPAPSQAPASTRIYRPRSLHRTSSEASLSSSYGEEDDDWKPLECGEPFSQSMSAITRLYVENNGAGNGFDDDDIDEDPKPNVQYFSRKNSVLRIPIPPRSSNRMLGNKRMIRRPSQLLRQSQLSQGCPPSGRLLASEDSGHSSSEATTPPQQPSPPIMDGSSTVSSSTTSSSSRHPLYDIQESGNPPGVKASRRSNASVDSGIRDSANSSPTFVTNLKMG